MSELKEGGEVEAREGGEHDGGAARDGSVREDENIWAKVDFLEHKKEYPGQDDNFIRTTRYTLLSFIPLTLLENYRVLTNVYFIIVLIICLLPLSPVNYLFTLVPMIVVLLISMARAGIEDFMKYREDCKRNNSMVKVYQYGEWVDMISSKIQVGDVIMLNANSAVPCDMLYLSSSKENQSAYFSSAELNGEAAVHTISPHTEFKGKVFPQFVTKQHFSVHLPEPDRDLYHMSAKLVSGKKFWPISISNVLLRGTTIHFTDWVMGVALRTGHDCKIMKNQHHPPAKMTQYDKDLNTMVIVVFCFKMVFVFVVSGLCCYYETHNDFSLLKDAFPSAGTSYLEAFLQWFVLFAYLIPLSLSATIEICRLFLLGIMSYDKFIVEEDRGEGHPHSSNLIGQLGVVTHVLSDKTGTLTENVMNMVKFTDENGTFDTKDFLSVGGKEPLFLTRSKTFLEALALCNTVIAYNNHGTIEYNAESPDESAFVKFAAQAKISLIQRESEFILVDYFGEKQKYDILSIIPFNSERKRMSIVLQKEGDPNAIVFVKGADSIMYPLCNETKYLNELNQFAGEGLRTLVFAQRALTRDELATWLDSYHEANSALVDREQRLDEISSMIEEKLDVVGVSAVEDRLQPSVPEAVLWLRNAGIAFWVLTGDKLETAIEIGRTSSIILPGADTLILSNSDPEQTVKTAKMYIEQFDSFTDPVLILTDHSTEFLLDTEDPNIIDLAKRCKSVIFSRSTPFMKSKIVSLVNKFPNSRTLAIGDGSNDVGMIQESHVGVGISGLEGNQAAMCSDFAIPRFRHLIRIIAVHGHWTLDRLQVVAMTMVYKNIVFAYSMFWMGFDTMFSPSSFYDGFFMSCYNLLFTLIPPFVYGWLEQDLPEAQLIRYPQLHNTIKNPMTPPSIVYYVFVGLFQSVVTYYVTRQTMPEASFTENGVFAFISIVLVVSFQVSTWCKYWNWVTFLANIGTIVVSLLVMLLYGGLMEYEIMGAILYDLKLFKTYAMILLSVIIGVGPFVIYEYLYDHTHPTLNRLLREREKLDRNGPMDFSQAMKMEIESDSSESLGI